ncbi:methyltransferase domain-containing protein [Photorhabdus kleinii]|uniref:thioesterase domain-containing protein n=1 Tax=Photorhabdus TaxID=29487 RepID=UPI0021D4A596|nr:thioesterase domain-containing protein [Photorhabdus kleinii]MCT8342001.1 methyltransferase domain-containing protein [Photorhabdus kleinii]
MMIKIDADKSGGIIRIVDIIRQTSAAGVQLFVEHGKLGFKVMSGCVFTPELKNLVIANKAEIIAFLVPNDAIKLVSLGADRTPLFLVPGAAAPVSSFIDLAREIKNDFCLKVFDATSLFLEGKTVTVKTLAERYVALLLQAYPQQHYRLVGDCVGACIAFEIALLLESKGKMVDLIAIDSFLIAYEQQPYTREEIDEVTAELAQGIEGEALESFIEVYKSYSMMTCNYVPSAKLKGKMTFIYCESSIQLRAEKEKIIASLQDYVTQPIICGMVSGDHYSVLKPGSVESLAEAILRQRYRPEPSFKKSNLTYQELLDIVQYRADIYRPVNDINHYHRVRISQVGCWFIEIADGRVHIDFNADDAMYEQYDFYSEIEISADLLMACVTSEEPAIAIAKAILDHKIQVQQGEELYHLLWIIFGITKPDEIFNWIDQQDSQDQYLGVQTDGIAFDDKCHINSYDGTYFMPAHYSVIHKALISLPIEYHDFQFIDLGCGKGRTIVCASNYNFSKITGVEIIESLALIAQQNVNVIKKKKNIEVIQGDVNDYQFNENHVVIYNYDSFSNDQLKKILQRLKTDIYDKGYKVFILQINGDNAIYQHCLWLTPKKIAQGFMGGWNITLWQSEGC